MRIIERAEYFWQSATGGVLAPAKSGLRILICDENEPPYDRHAGGARMHEIVKLLVDRAEVWFTPLRPHDDPKYRQDLLSRGVQMLPLSRFRYGVSTLAFDAAIVSRLEVGDELMELIRKHSPNTKIIFDTVDIASLRLERESHVTGEARYKKEAAKARRVEERLLRRADEVWFVTPVDAERSRAISPAIRKTRVVPTIHSPRAKTRGFTGRQGMLFIGGTHRPNIDAVRFFCDEIMPQLRASVPQITLTVAGSYEPAALDASAADDIILTGWVEDLSSILDLHRVFVCPLRYGSGMKGKIGEALAAGLPVVTTSIGAEGMDLVDGETAIIRDDPSDFAEAVSRLYNDERLWLRLSNHGKEFVNTKFSSATVTMTLDKAFAELEIQAN